MRPQSRLPTAAKLLGAVLFAALTYYVSLRILAILPGGGASSPGLAPLNAVLGAIMGWRVMGARAGDGFVPALGYSLTTIFVIYFWALLIWSAYEMFNRAVRGRYSGPVDALGGMGDLMLEYSSMIITPQIIGSAVIGAMICGLVTEFISHRWS